MKVIGVEVCEPDRIDPVNVRVEELKPELGRGIDEEHFAPVEAKERAMAGAVISRVRRRADLARAPHHRNPERGARSEKGQLHEMQPKRRIIGTPPGSKGFDPECVRRSGLMERETGRDHDGVAGNAKPGGENGVHSGLDERLVCDL